ncbi:MAG: DUF971 domain-containing protein [Planctomycetaceae bacterium]
MSASYPIQLEIVENAALQITWSDGQKQRYPFRLLRDACPCATCKEKQTKPKDPLALPLLTTAQIAPLKVTGMEPLGNYAYNIAFSDGHDTGIYTLDHLRQIGQVVN